MARKEKKPGIFARTTGMIGTTLGKTESVTYELLDTVESGTKILSTMAEELHNDSLEELVDSKVRLATAMAEARDTLKALGYTDMAIEATLKLKKERN